MSSANNNTSSTVTKLRVLGVFSLSMISMAAIISLRNLPLMAKYGYGCILFYAVAAVIFFIPLSFVAAELATTWPQEGGVYIWVKEAFGEQFGFFAIWLDWIANIIFFPTILSFIAASIAYSVLPSLAQNKFFLLSVGLIVYWITQIISLMGANWLKVLTTLGVLLGAIAPGLFIIILSGVWLITGHPIEITNSTFIPELDINNLVLFAGVILGFSGIEVGAYHAKEVKNPQRNYPLAILITSIVIIALFSLGSLAIAFVVPNEEISFVAGLMQAFDVFLSEFNLGFLTKIIAILVSIGSMALLSAWISGPSQGLVKPVSDHLLPQMLGKLNKYKMPVLIIMIQGIFTSIFVFAFVVLPNINSAYWMLTAVSSQVLVIMYAFIFAACLRLRYSQKNQNRPFQIPGGLIGAWIYCGVGVLGCLFTLFLGFLPPSNVDTEAIWSYEIIIFVGILIFILPPFFIYQWSKHRMKK